MDVIGAGGWDTLEGITKEACSVGHDSPGHIRRHCRITFHSQGGCSLHKQKMMIFNVIHQ